MLDSFFSIYCFVPFSLIAGLSILYSIWNFYAEFCLTQTHTHKHRMTPVHILCECATQQEDKLPSIGSTVTQRKTLKIREYFRKWVKVGSFHKASMHFTFSLSLSLSLSRCESVVWAVYETVCMCRDYTQICVQSLIFHLFTWDHQFLRDRHFFFCSCCFHVFGRWYRTTFGVLHSTFSIRTVDSHSR